MAPETRQTRLMKKWPPPCQRPVLKLATNAPIALRDRHRRRGKAFFFVGRNVKRICLARGQGLG